MIEARHRPLRVGARILSGFQRFGDHGANLLWFIRDKTHIPKTTRGIVVDVGSGHSPHYRAHILIERYADDASHRLGKPVARRHPSQLLLWGDIEKLPLKDKSVGFIIASHVLEHLRRPGAAVAEMTRAAHAGYIECPARWSEVLFPYGPHVWHVSRSNGTLIFEPKQRHRDKRLEQVFLPALQNQRHVRYLFRDRSFWTERLYWTERCPVTVNEDVETTEETSHEVESASPGPAANRLIGIAERWISSAVGALARPSNMSDAQLLGVLCCPSCQGDLRISDSLLVCKRCQTGYRRQNRTIDFQQAVSI
jgi:SAM-dependent methyltransferase